MLLEDTRIVSCFSHILLSHVCNFITTYKSLLNKYFLSDCMLWRRYFGKGVCWSKLASCLPNERVPSIDTIWLKICLGKLLNSETTSKTRVQRKDWGGKRRTLRQHLEELSKIILVYVCRCVCGSLFCSSQYKRWSGKLVLNQGCTSQAPGVLFKIHTRLGPASGMSYSVCWPKWGPVLEGIPWILTITHPPG